METINKKSIIKTILSNNLLLCKDCGVFILYSLFFLYKNKKLIEI